jgi:adenylate cyclase
MPVLHGAEVGFVSKTSFMEQDVSILIADLSGYTALTETHGAFSAADLIDKYIEIVNDSLVGTSLLEERTGDEVMIIATHADDLLATAKMLLQKTSEHNFLQIHGALHYGKLLKRNNSYFGSALNLTSRIASKASAGTFLCTTEFRDVVSDLAHTFKALGRYSFKNVAEEKEILEVIFERLSQYYIDPVCRMIINKEMMSFAHPHKPEILFCSQGCLEIYLTTKDK